MSEEQQKSDIQYQSAKNVSAIPLTMQDMKEAGITSNVPLSTPSGFPANAQTQESQVQVVKAQQIAPQIAPPKPSVKPAPVGGGGEETQKVQVQATPQRQAQVLETTYSTQSKQLSSDLVKTTQNYNTFVQQYTTAAGSLSTFLGNSKTILANPDKYDWSKYPGGFSGYQANVAKAQNDLATLASQKRDVDTQYAQYVRSAQGGVRSYQGAIAQLGGTFSGVESVMHPLLSPSQVNAIEAQAAFNELVKDGVVGGKTVKLGDTSAISSSGYVIIKKTDDISDHDRQLLASIGVTVPKAAPNYSIVFPGSPMQRTIAELKNLPQAIEGGFTAVSGSAESAASRVRSGIVQDKGIAGLVSAIGYTAIETGIGAFNALTFPVRPVQWADTAKLITDPSEWGQLKDYILNNKFDFLYQSAGGLVGGYFGGQLAKPVTDPAIQAIFDRLPSNVQSILSPNVKLSTLVAVDDVDGPPGSGINWVKGVVESKSIPRGAADIILPELKGVDVNDYIAGFATIDGQRVPVLRQYGDLIESLAEGQKAGPAVYSDIILQKLPEAEYSILTAEHGDLSLLSPQQVADLMWKEFGEGSPWQIPDDAKGTITFGGGKMDVSGIIRPADAPESISPNAIRIWNGIQTTEPKDISLWKMAEGAGVDPKDIKLFSDDDATIQMAKTQKLFDIVRQNGGDQATALKIISVVNLGTDPVQAITVAKDAGMSSAGIQAVAIASLSIRSGIWTSTSSLDTRLGLTATETQNLLPILVNPTPQNIADNFDKQTPRALSYLVPSLNADTISLAVPKIDPKDAPGLISSNYTDPATIAKIIDKLDNRTMIAILPNLTVDTVDKTIPFMSNSLVLKVVPTLTSEQLNSALQGLQSSAITAIVTRTDLDTLTRILNRVDTDTLQFIAPKLRLLTAPQLAYLRKGLDGGVYQNILPYIEVKKRELKKDIRQDEPEPFEVKFSYKGSGAEKVSVQARSFHSALSIGLDNRKSTMPPVGSIITKL